jgi:hypothetical protein
LLVELKNINLINNINSSNKFYDIETEIKKIDQKLRFQIIEKLKETADKYVKEYLDISQINLYNLRKGLEEFCGMKL